MYVHIRVRTKFPCLKRINIRSRDFFFKALLQRHRCMYTDLWASQVCVFDMQHRTCGIFGMGWLRLVGSIKL